MRNVIVYRQRLLPCSETFIRDQILAYRSWRGILLGASRVEGLDLEGLESLVLEQNRHRIYRHILNARLRLGIPPHFANLKRMNAELVHAHFGPGGLDAAAIAVALGLPLLVTLHGFDITINREWWEHGDVWTMRDYPRRLLKLSKRSGVHFVAVSDSIRRQAVEFGIAKEKITTCYIGTDTKFFTPSPIPIRARKRCVLFVGRLVEKKGCSYLIEAMVDVRKTIPDVRLVVIGGGPLRPALESLARRLEVEVLFLGAQPSSEVKKALLSTRVLCLPSVTAANGDAEGFGLVLLEAQACGVPVVTSAQGGRDEGIMDGVTGYAFSERDTVDLAAKLITLLTDDEIASAMSEAGPRFVASKFDIRNCTETLEKLYAACVERFFR